MSFNNKINRQAQTMQQPSFKDLAIQAAGQKAVSEIKENVPENIVEYGAKQGVQKLAPSLLNSVKPTSGLAGKLAGPRGMAAGMAIQGALSLAEEMQGPKKIFNDYYQDYVKLLNALASEYPQNQELQNMVNLGKQIGQKSHQIMMSSKVQAPTIGQAIGTGIQSGKDQVQGYVDMGKAMTGQQPKTALYNHKMQRLAIVGEAEVTRTLGEAGKGALIGFAGGLNPLSAILGAATGAAMPIAQNIFHHTRSDAYQSAAYTNQLKEKGYTLSSQLAKVDPQAAQMLDKYIYDLDNYVKQKIYKGGGTAFEKGIDSVTKFFTREKDQAVDQSTVDQANSMAQKPQSQQQEMSGQNSTGQEQPAENVSEQDPQISQNVQYLMEIYQQGMQYYNSGDAQNYNAIKTQYTQGLQNLNQYISQNYPDQDPNMILNEYVQQMQQMQQQGNMQQPQ
jgi:hypothetical protein